MRSEGGVPPRKERVPVVLDTNVVIAYYLSTSARSASRRIFHLWRDIRRLQLIVSREVEDEYVEVLRRVSVAENRLRRFRRRLEQRGTVTHVKLGPRPTASADPDDNVMLATALVGNAQYVITNDPDLLDIGAEEKRRFRFSILTPAAFLDELRRSEKQR
jgi:uncharacterized protein